MDPISENNENLMVEVLHNSIFGKILENISAVHASKHGETNCGFYEIPAILKNPISGFAKCGQPIIGRSCEGNLGEKCQFRR